MRRDRFLELMLSIFSPSTQSTRIKKPDGKSVKRPDGYRNLSAQNELLLDFAFDNEGSFLYHAKCLRKVFRISNSRLTHLHKLARARANPPIEEMLKKDIPPERLRDVIVPSNTPDRDAWFAALHEDQPVQSRQMIKLHQLQGRRSNRAKQEPTLHALLAFLDQHDSGGGAQYAPALSVLVL